MTDHTENDVSWTCTACGRQHILRLEATTAVSHREIYTYCRSCGRAATVKVRRLFETLSVEMEETA